MFGPGERRTAPCGFLLITFRAPHWVVIACTMSTKLVTRELKDEALPHSPTLSSVHLRHSLFSNPSAASPTSQLIFQPFFRFSYLTGFSLTSPGEPPMETTCRIHRIQIFQILKRGWRKMCDRQEMKFLLLSKVWEPLVYTVDVTAESKLLVSLSLDEVTSFNIWSFLPYVSHGRLARWIKWRSCDVGEAKEGLENELWHRWSNGRVGEWAVT